MTPGSCALLLGSLLSAPAVVRWLHDDLSTQDLLVRFGLATALALGAVQALVAVVSSYRVGAEEPVEPAPLVERRDDGTAPAAHLP